MKQVLADVANQIIDSPIAPSFLKVGKSIYKTLKKKPDPVETMNIDDWYQNNPEYSNLKPEEVLPILYEANKLEGESYRDFSKSMGYDISKGSRFKRSLIDTIENTIPSVAMQYAKTMQALGSLQGGEPLPEYEKIADWARSYEPVAPKLLGYEPLTVAEKQTWSSMIGGGFGSFATFSAMGKLKAMSFASRLMMLSGNTYLETEQEMDSKGFSEKDKLVYTYNAGLVDVALESIGLHLIAERAFKVGKLGAKALFTKTGAYRIAKTAIQGFTSEGIQEGTQNEGQHLLKKLYGLDAKLFEGFWESVLVGGIVGSVVSGAGRVMIEQHIDTTFKEPFRKKGFTDAETKLIVNKTYDIIGKELDANPEMLVEAVKALDEGMTPSEAKEKIFEKLVDKGMKAEEAMDTVMGIPEADASEIAKEVVAQETEETLYAFEEAKLTMTQQVIEAGYEMDKAEVMVETYSKMLEGLATKLGKTKIDIAKAIPIRIERGDVVGKGELMQQELKKIYHGTDNVFDEFDVSKSADGGIWFTDRKDLIEKGEVGAAGKGVIMERFIDENNLKLANWEQVDKYNDDELIQQGYDGYKLVEEDETTYKIFNPHSLKQQNDPLRAEALKYDSAEAFVESRINRDYGMSHRPTITGARADNISQEVSEMGLPKDFYDNPQYYEDITDKATKQSWDVLREIKDNPEAEIIIYRASPKKELNVGDWVTLSKEYAKGESLTEGVKVNSFKVKAKDIQFAGDSINEFGYYPQQLTDIYNEAHSLKQQTDPLRAEALKYDSADEFVKAQGETLYHGTDKDFNLKDIKERSKSINTTTFGDMETERHGFFLSDSKEFSEHFGKNIKEIVVKTENPAFIDNEIKLDFVETIDAFEERDLWLLAKNTPVDWRMLEGKVGERFVSYLKEQGYDSAKFEETIEDSQGEDTGTTTVVFDPSQIKTRQQLLDIYNEAHSLKQEGDELGFFSQLAKEVEGINFKSMPAKNLANQLKKTQGIKQAELEWTGIIDWLEAEDRKVNKEEVLAFIEQNGVQLKEVEKGEVQVYQIAEQYGFTADTGMEGDVIFLDKDGNQVDFEDLPYDLNQALMDKGTSESETKFGQYTLEGGENYREVLLTLPAEERTFEEWAKDMGYSDKEIAENRRRLEYDYRNTSIRTKFKGFKSSHFEEANILAHFRLNDRVDEQGKKTLFIEEIQSDWHQKGRKEGYKSEELKKNRQDFIDELKQKYKLKDNENIIGNNKVTQEEQLRLSGMSIANDNAVPDAPFKQTEAWSMLAFKRILRKAVAEGYDNVAWTTGEIQAERYDMSKQVNMLYYKKNNDGTFDIEVETATSEENIPVATNVKSDKLDDYVGKEIARKIIENEGGEAKYNEGFRFLKDADLKVGGEGMKGFYDKMLPKAVEKYARKLDKEANVRLIETGTKKDWFVQDKDGLYLVTKSENGEVEDVFDYKEQAQELVNKLNSEQKDKAKVYSLELTDKIKEKVMQGQSLFQKSKKIDQASYTRLADGTALIKLFEAKDDTSLMHEFAHQFFDVVNMLSPDMLAPVLADAGVKNIDTKANYTKAQEYFARSYEAFHRKGEAPTPELKSLFEKLSAWIRDVYKNMTDMKVQLTPTMEQFFNDMYAGTTTKQLTGIELFQSQLAKLRETKDQLLQRLGFGKLSRQEIEAEVSQKQEEQALHPKNLLKSYDKIYVPERLRDDIKNVIDAYKTKFTMKLSDNATNLDSLLPELAEITGVAEDRIIDAMDNAVRKGLPTKKDMREQAKKDLTEQYGLRKEPMTLRQMQTEITNYIKNLELEAKDKAKFLDTIKNATSETKLKNLIEKVSNRAKLLKEAQLKREVAKEITKELKTTKATSKGERYDYETNELFVKIRAYNKLSKENARITKEGLVNEVESEKDLPDNYERIQISFLEYKEMGLESDYQLMEQVYQDIKEMKRLGAEAKNEADFKAKVNRLEQRVELANAIVNNKLNKNVVLKTLASHYAINMGNIFNIVNAIANKEVANKMNLELSESDRMVGIFQAKHQMIKDASDVMGMTERQLYNALEKMAKEEYVLKRTDGVEVKFDKTQLLHMYLMIQNENTRNLVNRYYNFGEFEVMEYNLDGETYALSQPIGELIGNLSEKELQMADAVKYIVQGYYDSNNEVHIRRTGRALKTEENYFPRTSEYETDNPEIVPVGSEFASFQKDRKSGALPSPSNFWHVAERHIEQSEHIKTVSDRYIEIKKIINSNQVLETEAGNKTLPILLKETYGINVIKALNKALDRASIMALGNETNFALGMEGFFLNNWIKSKISLNPNVFLKQLTSVTNYAEDIPALEWTKYFTEGMANPKATFDYMWNNSPYLQARYKAGYNEQLSRIMKEANAFTKLHDLTNALTFLTKAGDIGAIIYGGYPAMQYHLAQGKTMKEAEVLFRQATIRSQQSGLGSSIDMKQADKNVFLRMFMAFKNTPRQYFRKIADVNIQLINGNINADQYVKTMLHYGVIQPALFGFVGGVIPFALGGGDDKDFWEYSFANIFRNIMLSPFLSMVLVGDIAQVAYRRLTNDRIYNVFSISMLDDVERAIKRLTKKSVTIGDFFTELLTTGVDIGAGLPATQTTRYVNDIIKMIEEMN